MRKFLACLFWFLGVVPALALGPIAPIGHTITQQNATVVTTSAIVGTAATLLSVEISWKCNGGITISSVADSSSNSWSALSTAGPSGAVCTALYYVENPTVSGSQTATVTFSASAPDAAVAFQSWKGMATPSSFDTSNTNTSGSGTTVSAGSITAAQADLVITAATPPDGSSGFPQLQSSPCSMIDSVSSSGALEGLGVGICGTAATINPTWGNFTSGASSAAVMAFNAPTTLEGSSKTNDYGILAPGTAAQESASKTIDYGDLNAGNPGKISASKSNVYIVLVPAGRTDKPIFHSFPP